MATTISIHAPREGCDIGGRTYRIDIIDFNPRTPRGVRPMPTKRMATDTHYFNPRTPRGVRHEYLDQIEVQ